MKETENNLKEFNNLEEELFNLFIKMRKKGNIFNGYKYDEFDSSQNSEEFKKGFLVGAKIASLILKDL